MTKKRFIHTVYNILSDALAANIAWTLFFIYRKYFIEPDKFGYRIPLNLDNNFYNALMYIPLFWGVLYFLSGYYKDTWKKSRIKDISNTLNTTVIGVVILFFMLLLDDEVKSYESYYKTTLTLFLLHFSFTTIIRWLFSSYIIRLLKQKKIGFNTIVIGNNQRTFDVTKELLSEQSAAQGYIIKGYVNGRTSNHMLEQIIPCLGTYEELGSIIAEHQIEEVLIGIESSNHNEINTVTNYLETEKVNQKLIPDLYDMMSGSVRMNNVVGTALIEINHDVMPTWQKVAKRMMDIVVSFFVLLFLLPVFILLASIVKMSSKGPIFYRQPRIGYKGQPFTIYKFRTMFLDAESAGPALSSKNDARITAPGKWMRKYRLDEFPQFYNILKGDMSLVGPRPERQYFIDQIVKVAPHYCHLHRVKPGLTSWGQVKYGYAENVEQMVDRLKFDILYIENRSLAIDFRIMIHTVLIILKGHGR